MSRPGQKPRPAPVTTIARTSGRPRARRGWRSRASSISRVQAFIRSGRFRVTVATPPSIAAEQDRAAVRLALALARVGHRFSPAGPDTERPESISFSLLSEYRPRSPGPTGGAATRDPLELCPHLGDDRRGRAGAGGDRHRRRASAHLRRPSAHEPHRARDRCSPGPGSGGRRRRHRVRQPARVPRDVLGGTRSWVPSPANVNYQYGAEELAYVLTDCDAAALVCGTELTGRSTACTRPRRIGHLDSCSPSVKASCRRTRSPMTTAAQPGFAARRRGRARPVGRRHVVAVHGRNDRAAERGRLARRGLLPHGLGHRATGHDAA